MRGAPEIGKTACVLVAIPIYCSLYITTCDDEHAADPFTQPYTAPHVRNATQRVHAIAHARARGRAANTGKGRGQTRRRGRSKRKQPQVWHRRHRLGP